MPSGAVLSPPPPCRTAERPNNVYPAGLHIGSRRAPIGPGQCVTTGLTGHHLWRDRASVTIYRFIVYDILRGSTKNGCNGWTHLWQGVRAVKARALQWLPHRRSKPSSKQTCPRADGLCAYETCGQHPSDPSRFGVLSSGFIVGAGHDGCRGACCASNRVP
jgi:hypothetical protein